MGTINLVSMPAHQRSLLSGQYLRICRWWNASGMSMTGNSQMRNKNLVRQAGKMKQIRFSLGIVGK